MDEGTILKYILFYILLFKNDLQNAGFYPVLNYSGHVTTMVFTGHLVQVAYIVGTGNKKAITTKKVLASFAPAVIFAVRKITGPFVYRLGHQIFILVIGVRFPYGLQKARTNNS